MKRFGLLLASFVLALSFLVTVCGGQMALANENPGTSQQTQGLNRDLEDMPNNSPLQQYQGYEKKIESQLNKAGEKLNVPLGQSDRGSRAVERTQLTDRTKQTPSDLQSHTRNEPNQPYQKPIQSPLDHFTDKVVK